MRSRSFSAVVAALTVLPALAVAVPAAGSPATTAPAPVGSIRIDFVRYDPAGRDSGSNAHINKEVVRIKNTTNSRRNLTGWTVRDKGSIHVYRFPRTTLRPGRSVFVHSGRGGDSPGQRFWDQGNYVWNNTGDQATLRTDGSRLIDRCSWNDGDGTTGC